MKIFLTGASGFIGGYFLRAALESGCSVTALRRKELLSSLDTGAEAVRLEWITGGLDEIGESHLEGHDVLVHMAAYGVSPQPCEWLEAFRVNVKETIHLFERASRAGVRRIVVSGSCTEYGRSAERYERIPTDAPLDPVGPYAASKASQSVSACALCREVGFELAILRLFSVYGGGQHAGNFWPSLREAAASGRDFPMSPGCQVRDFTHVRDIAQVFLAALSSEALRPGEPLVANVGSGKPHTLREFAKDWWTRLGATGRLLVGALPYREGEVMRYVPLTHPEFSLEPYGLQRESGTQP